MTKREIGSLACKVLAIYVLIQGIRTLEWPIYQTVNILQALLRGQTKWQSLGIHAMTIIVPVIEIACAVWLWKRAGVVAAWMTGHDLQDSPDEPDSIRVPADLSAVHAVVLSCMGVWVLIGVVPEIVSQALVFVISFAVSAKQSLDEASRVVSGRIWTWAAQFAIGFWLIFGAPSIVRMLRRFAYTGLQHSEQPPPRSA